MTIHDDDLTLVGTADFKADAHARYAALRAQGPIHRVARPTAPPPGWSSTTNWAARPSPAPS
ncbi:hypothetical protein [Streptosporangium sp. NPDC050280]|uniref:hypothetical protein n=1 Tax=unclassified Streptosporangium TaxID=2632669 RepID=UPI00342F5056